MAAMPIVFQQRISPFESVFRCYVIHAAKVGNILDCANYSPLKKAEGRLVWLTKRYFYAEKGVL